MGRLKASMLDEHQMFQMAFNDAEKSFDVSIASDLCPPRYDEYSTTYDANFNVQYIDFFGHGTPQVAEIILNRDHRGQIEIVMVQLQTVLDGAYFVLHDSVGSVGVQLKKTSPIVPPTDRVIVVNYTNETRSQLLEMLKDALNLDGNFAAYTESSALFVSYITPDNYPPPIGVNFAVNRLQIGYPTIASQSFTLTTEVGIIRVWFTLDGNGVDPTQIGEVGVVIPTQSSQEIHDVYQLIIQIINGLNEFAADSREDLTVYWRRAWEGSAIATNSPNFSFRISQKAKNPSLIGRIGVSFIDGFQDKVTRLL